MLGEFDWNQALEPEVLGTFMALLIPIVGTIVWGWRGIEKTRSDNALKRTLVERGMSVDEIERVLAAKSSRD